MCDLHNKSDELLDDVFMDAHGYDLSLDPEERAEIERQEYEEGLAMQVENNQGYLQINSEVKPERK